MTLTRTECLLLLLYAPGANAKEGEKIVGMTKLQKLLFLLGKEGRLENILPDYFKHIAYKFGPFSQELLDELELLKELKLIQDFGLIVEEGEGQTFELTERGLEVARKIVKETPKDILKKVINIKTVYGSQPINQLLRYVYSKYPEYAVYSEAKL